MVTDHLQPIGQSELALTFGLVVHPVVLLPTSLIFYPYNHDDDHDLHIIAMVVMISVKKSCISYTFSKIKTIKTLN